MSHLGDRPLSKTAFTIGGMGLTALAALTVTGPLAAATVAVSGRPATVNVKVFSIVAKSVSLRSNEKSDSH